MRSLRSIITLSPVRSGRAADVENSAVRKAGVDGTEMTAHVQLGDVGASAGEHHGVVASHDRGPPVAQQEGLGVAGIVADGDVSVVEVGVEGVGGVAVAELAEGFDLPLVLLAPVVPELDDWLPLGQRGEQSAGGDLGELPWVTDEHGLGAGVLHVVEQAGEVAGARGTGLVDDQHRALVEACRVRRGRS